MTLYTSPKNQIITIDIDIYIYIAVPTINIICAKQLVMAGRKNSLLKYIFEISSNCFHRSVIRLLKPTVHSIPKIRHLVDNFSM